MTKRTKQQPLGICDTCESEIPLDLGPYTSKGKPRLDCSIQCRAAANSRSGAKIRGEQTKQRIADGIWVNPADIRKPDPAKVAAGVSRARKAEVAEGRWRNPALDDQARKKLSRPRVHGDNPALHRAIEKLGQGLSVSDLTDEEAEAHRAHSRARRAARKDEVNAWYRNRYHKQQAAMTPEEHETQRESRRLESQRKIAKKSGEATYIIVDRSGDVRTVRLWRRQADGNYQPEIIGYIKRLKRECFQYSREATGPWGDRFTTVGEIVQTLKES